MSTLTDMNDASCSTGVPLPNDPFVALHPHYGMLLGVADFQADQAYHRGKMRLHNAWAHGWGVLWGLGVSVDASKGEVAVAPGLALDGRGRELHNDGAMCLNVARWFEAHRNDAGFVFTDTAGVITFEPARVRFAGRRGDLRAVLMVTVTVPFAAALSTGRVVNARSRAPSSFAGLLPRAWRAGSRS